MQLSQIQDGEDPVLAMLKATFGYSQFRPLQENIVRTILSGEDAFVLLPTGGGKSLCYQLPALLMDSMTVVVSPLIALMKDQVDAMTTLGVAATFINSSLASAEISQRQTAVARGVIKLLYVAPERLVTPAFMQLLSATGVSLFAIDEAHCVSEWGHDFRPEYRELRQLRARFPNATYAALTATATPKVQSDIRTQLGLGNAASFQGSFNRGNLYYEVREKQRAFDQIVAYIRQHRDASGIIYCHSRASVESVAERLRTNGIRAAAYHGGMDGSDRQHAQEAFVRDDVQVVVATIAFGMGIDKPDVRFVFHYDMPKNLEGFYQESGRAGRDGDPADCILFYSYGDVAKHRHFIDEKPTPALRNAALSQLQQMADWAESPTCRRVALLNYFDEDFAGQDGRCCDACDAAPTEREDYSVPAQMFLSCIKRTGERFGATYVIDVLRGSQAERIVRFGHDRLSTWGIGKDRPKEEWQYLSRALIRAGHVLQDENDYNALKITQRGYDVLFKGEHIVLPKAPVRTRSSSRGEAAADDSTAHPDLFQNLRVLRKQLADDRGVPPYVVFPDTTLRQLAARLPQTPADMLRITGVGQRKLQEFGGEFLVAIRSFVGETGATAVSATSEAPVQRIQRSLSMTAASTLELIHDGMTVEAAARERGLALTTVEGHVEEAIESGALTSIESLVANDRRATIEAAIGKVGDELLRPIMDELGDGFTFADIRFVRAARRATS